VLNIKEVGIMAVELLCGMACAIYEGRNGKWYCELKEGTVLCPRDKDKGILTVECFIGVDE